MQFYNYGFGFVLVVLSAWTSTNVALEESLTCNWTMIDDKLSAMHVSVGPAGVWLVSKDYQVYYREGTYANDGTKGKSWIQISGTNMTLVDVGTRIVWALSTSGHVYFRTGIDMYNPTGCDWRRVYGVLKSVTVSPEGHVWGITLGGGVVRRAGVTEKNPAGRYWHSVGPTNIKFEQISAGCAGVWGIVENKTVLYRQGTYDDPNTPGEEWNYVPDALSFVTVGHGRVWGIKGDYITYRAGVAQARPTGVEWTLVYKTLSQFDVWTGSLWGADSYDPEQVYARLL